MKLYAIVIYPPSSPAYVLCVGPDYEAIADLGMELIHDYGVVMLRPGVTAEALFAATGMDIFNLVIEEAF